MGRKTGSRPSLMISFPQRIGEEESGRSVAKDYAQKAAQESFIREVMHGEQYTFFDRPPCLLCFFR